MPFALQAYLWCALKVNCSSSSADGSVGCQSFEISCDTLRATVMMIVVPKLFYRFFWEWLLAIFSGRNLLWHASAILLTIALVMSGGDWAYYRWTRADVFLVLALPALGLGMLMPLLGPLSLLLFGLASKNRRLTAIAWALGQAPLSRVTVITSSYKVNHRTPPASISRPRRNACVERPGAGGFQPRLSIWFFARRHLLGLAVGAHHGGVFDGALPDDALSQEQDRGLLRVALCVLHWACRFCDHPLVFRVCSRSHHRKRDWNDGWPKL